MAPAAARTKVLSFTRTNTGHDSPTTTPAFPSVARADWMVTEMLCCEIYPAGLFPCSRVLLVTTATKFGGVDNTRVVVVGPVALVHATALNVNRKGSQAEQVVVRYSILRAKADPDIARHLLVYPKAVVKNRGRAVEVRGAA
jgi:hypothetical protein